MATTQVLTEGGEEVEKSETQCAYTTLDKIKIFALLQTWSETSCACKHLSLNIIGVGLELDSD